MIRVSIGLDPGLAACGLAVLCRADSTNGPWKAWIAVTLRTKPPEPLGARLRVIYEKVESAMQEVVRQGTLMTNVSFAIEDQTGVSEGKRREGKTNADALLVHQVVGALRAVAWNAGVTPIDVSPQEAKRLLSGMKGTADKNQLRRAVRALVSGCPKVMSQHASDAVAIALAGARRVRS